MGISSDVDLKNYDPIKALTSNGKDVNAKKVLIEQTKIQMLISVISNTVNGLVDDADTKNYLSSTFDSIATKLENAEDITDSSVIDSMIDDAVNDALSQLNQSQIDEKKTKLNGVKNAIRTKIKTAIDETVNQIEGLKDNSILDIANSGLNIVISQIATKSKIASKNGDSTSLDNFKVKEELDKKYVEKSKKFINKLVDVKFEAIKIPLTDETQQNIQNTKAINVNGNKQVIDFKVLRATGEFDNGEIFGQVKDYQDQPIQFDDSSNYICNGTNAGVGSGLDFSSILQRNNKLYMVNQFECSIGAMYMFELEQDPNTGVLSPKKDTLQYISQKDEFGGFTLCRYGYTVAVPFKF